MKALCGIFENDPPEIGLQKLRERVEVDLPLGASAETVAQHLAIVLGLDPANIWRCIEDLIRYVWNMGFDAVVSLWRYFLLGAVVVIPIWLILQFLRAPR